MNIALTNHSAEKKISDGEGIFAKKEKSVSIIEHAWNTLETFRERPLDDVDSLIFSQLCYMHIGLVAPSPEDGRRPAAIKELFKTELFDGILDEVRDPESNRKLLTALCASPRYRDVKMAYFVDSIDREREKQFCAVTFFLPGGEIYIAFRGTDATIVGWKEDFNMIIEQTVPSQRSALTYLEKVAGLTRRPIYIGGHSKGGNLALYSAVMAPDDIRKRIICVYNHDGPGLVRNILKTGNYARIKDRIKTTLPQKSLIGIIFNNGEYQTVKSDRLGIMQHDPFSWEIKDGNFVYGDKVSESSDMVARSVAQMAADLSAEEKRIFVDTVFDIIYSTGYSSFAGWPQAAIKEGDRMIGALKNIDSETAEKIKGILAEIIKIIFKNIISSGKNTGEQK